MRSVLAYTMRTKERGRGALQNRVYKYARVLEYFHRDDVISDEVPQRLKDGGGIDAIYAALCRDARPPEGRGSGSEEPLAELPLARTADGTTDGAADTPAVVAQGRMAAGAIDGNDCRLYDDGRQPADESQRKSVPLATAANDATNTLRGELQTARPSKRGRLNHIDLKTTLAIEMFEFELEEVLHAKRVMIRAIMGPPDDRGWVPVQAVTYLTSNSAEGPWPGWPARNNDDDERP